MVQLSEASLMLDQFVVSNRYAIIARTTAMARARETPQTGVHDRSDSGIPDFLDQLVAALRLTRSTSVTDHAKLTDSAGKHGEDLLRMGLTIAEVVRDYGDVCQTITELALEQDAPISTQDFRTLNLCLDDATAAAVSVYARQNDRASADRGTERLGILAQEMRNLLNTAMLSFDIIKSGRVGAGGSTGLVHDRSLVGLRNLIDRALTDVRLDAGIERLEQVPVARLFEDVQIGAALEARGRNQRLTVSPVDRKVVVRGDRQILAAAISNLLQNAFKFTRTEGHVVLRAVVAGDRVLIEVEDECGGLPPGKLAEMFQPFSQRGADRTGLGLGLSICQKAAKASGGEVRARDLPLKGCVFTLDLPTGTEPSH